MKLRKFSLISLNLLSSLILNSCASIHSFPVCVELNPSRAFCTHTIEDKDFYISDIELFEGKTYWDIRPSMILVPASSWEILKTDIIKLCKITNKCDSSITSWDQKVKSIDKLLSIKK